MKTESVFPKNSKLAAYLRDSGHEDQEISIDQQENAIRNWCNRQGYELTRVYRDESRGSSTENRDEFNKMMDYFKSDFCIEAGIVVWKYNRFARDINDAQYNRSVLRRRGFEIISLNDNIPDGPAAVLFEAAIDWMNQTYLEDLSKDIKRGQNYIIEQYKALGGTPPLGFVREKVNIASRRDGRDHVIHKWVPTKDEDLLDRIRLAWQMRADGETYAKISRETRLYKSSSCYPGFFKNRIYIGEMKFGETLIDDYCEPIIDITTFERVQEINLKHVSTKSNGKHPRQVNSPYLLSGLVYCANCGAAMIGANTQFKKTAKYIYYYYQCNAVKRHLCETKKIRKEILENLILDQLVQHILEPDNMAVRIQEEIISQENQAKSAAKKRASLNKKITHIHEQIERLTAVIAMDDIEMPRAIVKKLSELEQQERDLKYEIQQIGRNPELQPLKTAQLEDLRRTIRSLEKDQTKYQELKNLLAGLIQRIDVTRDEKTRTIRGQILYYIPQIDPDSGKNLVSIAMCPRRDTSHRHQFLVSL